MREGDMSRLTTVAGKLGLAGLAVLLQLFPNFAFAASPLRLECSAQQTLPGRSLACEYSVIGRLNEQLADLHDQIVRDGRAARVNVRRWLGARDACRDVDCLDKVLQDGIEAARMALVDVESREPTPVLTTARGIPLRVMPSVRTPARPAVAPEGERPPSAGARTMPTRSPARFEPSFGMLLLLFAAAAVLYTVVVVRISRPA